MSERALLTPTEAIVPRAVFDRLPEYSCSLPTGTTLGKRWKREKRYGHPEDGWWLGEFEKDPDPRYVRIRWRDLLVIDPVPAVVGERAPDPGGAA